MKCMPLPPHLVYLIIMSQSLHMVGKTSSKQDQNSLVGAVWGCSCLLTLDMSCEKCFIMTKRCKTNNLTPNNILKYFNKCEMLLCTFSYPYYQHHQTIDITERKPFGVSHRCPEEGMIPLMTAHSFT